MLSRGPLASPRPASLTLATEVQYVKGVGPRLAQLLGSRGVFTVEDLVSILPFRYEDRSQLRSIPELTAGEAATVIAQIRTLGFRQTHRGSTRLEMSVGDGRGILHCVWYNAEYLRDRFQSGQTLALYGKPALSPASRRLEMQQPEFELLPAPDGSLAPASAAEGELGAELGVAASLKLGRIVPVYEALGTLTAGRLRRLVHRALEALPEALPDPLPMELRQRLKLPARRAALEQVHFPGSSVPLADLEAARTPGHVRLILEEFFCLQAGLELKRRRVRRQPGPAIAVNPKVRERLKRLLPFHPTSDQKQVLREIVTDMRGGRPMRRLLQGDVGSGKTIVALEAAVVAMENGWQVALMAPTQILAEQHYFYATERLPGYRVRLVTAATQRRPARLRASRSGTDSPAPQLIIGTQALLEGGFSFSRLGLVIVDEQHRFGVRQRFQLMHKDASPDDSPAHVLVMTATPIPRTLALTLYGDLESSFIRHAPPGAMAIVTRALPQTRSPEVYEFVRRRVALGRQAYFVYPIIEESETLELKPALQMVERLQQLYPEFHVGLLHGKLKSDEKARIMADFRAGDIQILVSTTVVEVGVDVPNATLMVIEHAERFGIAQLHQLRGRVGRPQPPPQTPRSSPHPKAEQSHCFLLHGEPLGESARQRLQALVRTRDGFELAETDLKLRGPGEFFGTRQSGTPTFQIAQPIRDQALLELARDEARHYLDHATPAELRQLVQHIQQRWQRQYGLVEVG